MHFKNIGIEKKKERNERGVIRKIKETGRAAEHWEKELRDGQEVLKAECRRIEKNERIVSPQVFERVEES
jgi:hypothetical protein